MKSNVMQGLVEKYGVRLPSPQAVKEGMELILKDDYDSYSRRLVLSVCNDSLKFIELDSYYIDSMLGEILELPLYQLSEEIYSIPKTYVFEDLLTCIRKPMQLIVRDFLENYVPMDFWFRASSSTGKYHPSCENGTEGLVRHTVRVAEIVKNLAKEVDPNDYDLYIAAALIHDTFKYPTPGLEYTEFMHPELAADAFRKYYDEECPESLDGTEDVFVLIINDLVRTHHGCFNKSTHSEGILKVPCTYEEWLLHYADYMASMKLSYE